MEELYEISLPELAQEVAAQLSRIQLPDSDEVSRWALETDRRVYLDGDVDYMLIKLHRLILRWNMEDRGVDREHRKPIWLYIMSYGGDIDYMWMLIDAICTSETPIYTVNLGVAGSAASLIFLSGAKRYMTPTARLVIHEGSAQLSGDAVKVMDQSEAYKKQLKQMKEFILNTTEIPRSQLMKKRNNDWELDADYCLAHGCCDYIIGSMEEIC